MLIILQKRYALKHVAACLIKVVGFRSYRIIPNLCPQVITIIFHDSHGRILHLPDFGAGPFVSQDNGKLTRYILRSLCYKIVTGNHSQTGVPASLLLIE